MIKNMITTERCHKLCKAFICNVYLLIFNPRWRIRCIVNIKRPRLWIFIIAFCIFLYLYLNGSKRKFSFKSLNSTSEYYKSMRRKGEEKVFSALRRFTSVPIIDLNVSWKQLTNNTYVYSAYIDECIFNSKTSCVKFIGISKRTEQIHYLSNIKCAFKNGNISYLTAGSATIIELPENHEQLFTASHFYCAIPHYLETVILKYASLFSYSGENITWVPITKSQTFKNKQLTICVRPFFGTVSILDLGEFIAYYSSMGADHFIFYETNVSSIRSVFLANIKEFISFELLLWNIPLTNDDIHEYGQIAFNHDCVLRSYRQSSTHVTIVDLDEFIVPKQHDNLIDLISYLDTTFPNYGSFIIPSALFCSEYELSTSSLFRIFTYLKRQTTIWEHKYRSKLIFRPDRVKYVGIHFIFEHNNGLESLNVLSVVALLHHYKSCNFAEQDYFFHLLTFNVLEDNVVEDDSLLNFRKKILQHKVSIFVQQLLNVF